MDSRVESYLAELEACLRGRLPADEVRSVVSEMASHLVDLVDEMGGDVDGAIKKFGPAARFARRLLLDRQVVPSPWRAAVWPLGAALAYLLWMILVPASWLMGLASPGPLGFDWLYLTASLAWIVVFAGFFRARQILWKPLVAVAGAFFVVAVLTGPIYHFVVPVTGGSQIVNRAIAGQMSAQLQREAEDLAHARAQLELGMRVFRGDRSNSVPAELTFAGMYRTPDSIATPERLDASEAARSWIPAPVFVSSVAYPAGEPVDWNRAVAAWRLAPSSISRVDREIARRRAIVAGMPGAQGQGYWTSVVGLAGPWAFLVFRTALILLEMNLIAWTLWQVSRRVVWPRRRLA